MQETIENFGGLPHGTKQGRLATVKLFKKHSFSLASAAEGRKSLLQCISAAT